MLIKIEALKNICGVGVFQDYQDLEEFNVRKYQQRHVESLFGKSEPDQAESTEPKESDVGSQPDARAQLEGSIDSCDG